MAAKTVITTDHFNTYTIDTPDTNLVLEESYIFYDQDGDALVQDPSVTGSRITIKGYVESDDDNGAGIRLDGGDSVLTIARTASIIGYDGIRILGESQSVSNSGTIAVTLMGIRGTASDMHIVNRGAISANWGIFVEADGALIENDGRIQAQHGICIDGDGAVVKLGKDSFVTTSTAAIENGNQTGEHYKLVNEGTISAANKHAFLGYDGDDVIINRGTIRGNIALGEGDDVFDTAHGNFSGGYIGGNAGDDTYILKKANVLIDEYVGEGTDTVRSTVTFSFSSNKLAGFELDNLRLIGRKNIDATGNEFANSIVGNSGANRIDGRVGADVLAGGAGNDVFLFSNGYGSDRVVDFGKGDDRVDLSGLTEVTGFGDLMQHHVVQAGADLKIVAGSDTLVLEDVRKSDLHVDDFVF